SSIHIRTNDFQRFEPPGILYIIISDPVDFPVDQLRRNGFYFFSRHTGINASRLTDSIIQQHRPGNKYSNAVTNRVVHYNGSHPYQYIIMNAAAMYNCIMADRYIIADRSAAFLIGAMNNGAVLYIYLITHFYIIYISPHNSIKPK